MLTGFSSHAPNRFQRPARAINSYRAGHPLRYGLRQENELRDGLRRIGRLTVTHDVRTDKVYKLDAVVTDRERPESPAVGIQFTTRRDPQKRERTIAAVQRTEIVARFLYLEAECPLAEPAFEKVRELVRDVARRRDQKGILCAVLFKDHKGCFAIKRVAYFPIHAPTGAAEKAASKPVGKEQ